MRKLTTLMIATVIATGAVAPAFADPPHHGRGRHERDWRDGDRHRNDRYRDYRDDRRGHNDRYDRDERYAYRDGYRDGRRSDNWRHDGWRRDHVQYRWRPGYYVPRDYSYRRIDDWGYYHLPAPRHGHHYVECDGEILLVAAATGLIVWALTN